ncbi:hypothetical protein [Mariniflexile sp. HNIBRBA6329]|uniref:hypothetical protein n=1 Tax=Mariniflexile sp. HNIBRBA6329 TaxID=3373088 RepID=UPI0037499879
MTKISIIILIGVPFLLLFGRKRKWNTDQLKKTIAVGFTIIGLIGFAFSATNEFRLLFYSFVVTPVFIMIDNLFRNLSIKKHNRDLNLWLNYSDDVYGIFAPMTSSKFKTTDVFFSITLLILIVGLAFIGVVLFGKEDLYSRLIN